MGHHDIIHECVTEKCVKFGILTPHCDFLWVSPRSNSYFEKHPYIPNGCGQTLKSANSGQSTRRPAKNNQTQLGVCICFGVTLSLPNRNNTHPQTTTWILFPEATRKAAQIGGFRILTQSLFRVSLLLFLGGGTAQTTNYFGKAIGNHPTLDGSTVF